VASSTKAAAAAAQTTPSPPPRTPPPPAAAAATEGMGAGKKPCCIRDKARPDSAIRHTVHMARCMTHVTQSHVQIIHVQHSSRCFRDDGVCRLRGQPGRKVTVPARAKHEVSAQQQWSCDVRGLNSLQPTTAAPAAAIYMRPEKMGGRDQCHTHHSCQCSDLHSDLVSCSCLQNDVCRMKLLLVCQWPVVSG
jgi:hypothetical protein